MLWFALHLAGLPLEAWSAGAPDANPNAPLAATPAPDKGGPAHTPSAAEPRPCCVVQARGVVQACARATAAGVVPGMSAATAASLVAGLHVLPRDLAREAAQVQRLALALSRFTPQLVLQPDGVWLEVSASQRLFGGARALWQAVRDQAQAAGVRDLRMAAAPTATAAALLARVPAPRLPRPGPTAAHPAGATPARREAVAWRQAVAQRLDALPLPPVLAAWQLEPRLADLLHGIGCRTLGDVRMLPRTGLQRRGAAPLLDAMDRAYGHAPDPQLWYEPPPRFELGLELMHRADDAAMLVFAAQRLVQPLAGWLAQQWRAATQVTLVLRHDTSVRHAHPDTVLLLSLGDPTRDAAHLLLLLRERLQRTTLPAPVYALVLRLDQSVAHAGRDTPLWRERGSSTAGEDASALFDRLAARLGPERVQRAQLVADHRPERAMRWVPLQERSASPTPLAGPALTAPRPTWWLPEPQPLADAPGGRSPLYQGAPLRLLSRAERIEAGWFDGHPVSRDYHLAQTRDARWLWVFRERRGAQAQWFLQGLFG